MSRFISLSSTNSILAIRGFLSNRAWMSVSFGFGMCFRLDPGLHQLAHLIEQLVAIVLALLINSFHVTLKLLAVFHREVFRRQDDDRNVLPVLVLPQLLDEVEPVHHWHHQVQENDRRSVLRNCPQPDLAILRLANDPTFLFQHSTHHLADGWLVLDHQDLRWSLAVMMFAQHSDEAIPVDRLG